MKSRNLGLDSKMLVPKSEFLRRNRERNRNRNRNRNSDFDIEIGISGNRNIKISTKLTYNFVGISISSKVKRTFVETLMLPLIS
jgi:hypothetical protein